MHCLADFAFPPIAQMYKPKAVDFVNQAINTVRKKIITTRNGTPLYEFNAIVTDKIDNEKNANLDNVNFRGLISKPYLILLL